jgi:hypothetical protein
MRTGGWRDGHGPTLVPGHRAVDRRTRTGSPSVRGRGQTRGGDRWRRRGWQCSVAGEEATSRPGRRRVRAGAGDVVLRVRHPVLDQRHRRARGRPGRAHAGAAPGDGHRRPDADRGRRHRPGPPRRPLAGPRRRGQRHRAVRRPRVRHRQRAHAAAGARHRRDRRPRRPDAGRRRGAAGGTRGRRRAPGGRGRRRLHRPGDRRGLPDPRARRDRRRHVGHPGRHLRPRRRRVHRRGGAQGGRRAGPLRRSRPMPAAGSARW